MPLIELQATLNGAARSKASSLISSGKVKQQSSWSGPSSGAENAYLSGHSWAEYGKWFLGHDKEQPEDVKARYKYPYSDDFEKVSVNGLRAIRSRAAQNHEEEIFEAAGTLLSKAKDKLDLGALKTHAFSQTGLSSVNLEDGTMSDVSIIEIGEARGHGILITETTLKRAMEQLVGKSLPAYITHVNAQGDRLTSEVGYFSGFYLETDLSKIRARNFRAFETFRKYKPEQYEQLFEMAATLPESFGISLVFEARLYWEMPEREEKNYSGMASKPDEALYEWPSVEMTSIQSADFVDNPAANRSLFSSETQNHDMNIELTTAASEALEKARAEAEAAEQAPQKKEAAAPKKKAARKKKLSAEGETTDDLVQEIPLEESCEIENAQQEVIDDLELRLSNRDELIGNLINELNTLKSLMGGAEEIEEDAAPEEVPVLPLSELKEAALKAVMDSNPELSKSQALLEVGKKNPEFFHLN